MNNIDCKKKTLSNLDSISLLNSVIFFKKELLKLRFQKTFGELTNTSRFIKVRKNIARIKTELAMRKKK